MVYDRSTNCPDKIKSPREYALKHREGLLGFDGEVVDLGNDDEARELFVGALRRCSGEENPLSAKVET